MSTMLRRLFGPVLVMALALGFALPARAQDAGPMVDESTNLWFVELSSPPKARGGNAAAIQQEKTRFRAEAAQFGVKYRERTAFDTLWNGLSIEAHRGDLNKLSKLSGVKAVYPVLTASLPQPEAATAPDMATALAMTGADVAQSELGFTGKGIKVGVIDSGIDYLHPDLGGGFGAGFKVAYGYDFVGDDYNAQIPGSTPRPDPDPMDCGGHGTHVAGIVGANGDPAAGGVRGVAPDAILGAYRVFGCEGSTTADVILQAYERAYADGMQIINQSLGFAFMTWPQYPTAAASDALVDKGVVMVASIGNSGASGVWSAGAPGVGNKVIGVASFDNTAISALTFVVNPTGQRVAYLPMLDNTPTSGTTPEVVWVGQGCNADQYLGNPSGKVALIVRGGCTFNEKYQRAVDVGAVAVVIYNNVPGIFAGGGVIAKNNVPAVGVSQADGLAIRELLTKNETVTLTWTDVRVNAPNPTGGLISSFSSYGMTAELNLKPDLGAPGGLIRSTYPRALGAYSILSGTSMAAPHVAGAAALLMQAEPKLATELYAPRLQNSAVPQPWSGNRALGFLDFVHRQGAGMIQIDDSITATTLVTPGKLSLGESEAGPATRTLTIRNTGSQAVTYQLGHQPALATGGNTNAPSFLNLPANAAFSAPSVTVPAGGAATVDVTITAPNADKVQYGGYITLTGGGRALRVPYAGFAGDYQSIKVLEPTAFGFPWLAKLDGGSYLNQPRGATFTMRDGDVPYFLVHFEHPARLMKMEVFEATADGTAGKPVHPVFHEIFNLEYIQRNSTATGFFAFPWDGTRFHNNGNDKVKVVPNGKYVVKMSVLKALGDPKNSAHWESWNSPVITIAR
jgi:minor extracellular serine protease Vpr